MGVRFPLLLQRSGIGCSALFERAPIDVERQQGGDEDGQGTQAGEDDPPVGRSRMDDDVERAWGGGRGHWTSIGRGAAASRADATRRAPQAVMTTFSALVSAARANVS